MGASEHFKKRCKQRGISQEQVSIILKYGEKIRKSGGAFEYRLMKKEKDQLVSDLKKKIHMVERSAGKGVLVSDDESTIITTYHII